jgi:DNA-binding MarR family transcriptional regulator
MVAIAPQFVGAVLVHLTALKLGLAQYYRISLRELMTLGLVAGRGEASLTALHKSLSIPKSAVTALVDRLHARGMLQRRQDPEDRRRWLVSLTPSGKRLVEGVQEEESRLVQDALGKLSDAEQRAFIKALNALKEELAEAGPAPPTLRKGVYAPRSRVSGLMGPGRIDSPLAVL